MSLASTFRWFPVPFKYGKCGGQSRNCSPSKPIDALDALFEKHDKDLYSAKEVLDLKYRSMLEERADKKLVDGLRNLDPSTLTLYGRFYRWLAMIVFN